MADVSGSGARVAVVGAGLAGLACADALAQAGLRVTVFDKGRFPGGRLASRNRDHFAFDYGAQYFSARNPQFRKFILPLVRKKKICRWNGKFATDNCGRLAAEVLKQPRYVGVPVMRSIVDELAGTAICHFGHLVSSVYKKDGKWCLAGNKQDNKRETVSESFSSRDFISRDFISEGFDFLVLNLPPEQAAALHPHPQLSGVRLLPCIALLLAFEERLPIDFDGIKLDDSLLSWVARDSSKPGRGAGERWVLHASPGWSQENLQSDSAEITEQMTARFAAIFKIILPETIFSKVHKWKYALPEAAPAIECLLDSKESIVYCGDWCLAPRVEGAYLSGLAAAEQVLANV